MEQRLISEKWKRVLGIITSLIFLLQGMLSAITVKADEVVNEANNAQLDFVKEIKLTDWNGSPLGDDVSLDSNVMVNCEFEVKEGTKINEGDVYYINLPKEIYMSKVQMDIFTDEGETIGTCTGDSSGKLVVTFNKLASEANHITGKISLKTKFNKAAFETGGDKDLVFNLQSKKQIIHLTFEEYQAEYQEGEALPKAKIATSGGYDKANNRICWTIDVDCGSQQLNEVKVEDILGEDQRFDVEAIKVRGKFLKEDEYSIEGNKLTYTFDNTITGVNRIYVYTKLNESFFKTLESSKKAVNTAAVTVGDGEAVSKGAEVTVPTQWMKKTGNYVSGRKIEWTINLYNQGESNNLVKVVDQILEGQEYVSGTLKYSDSETSIASTESDVLEVNGGIFKYENGQVQYIGTLDRNMQLTFQTEVSNEELFIPNVRQKIENIAKLYPTGESLGIPEKVESTSEIIIPQTLLSKKKGIKYNTATRELNWKIELNNVNINLNNPYIEDTIESSQEFDESSLIIDGEPVSLGEFKSSYENNILKIYFESGKQNHTIEYKTKVKDNMVYANNVTDVRFYNQCLLKGDNGAICVSAAEQYISSNVIRNVGKYDYNENLVVWTVTVNDNKLPMKGAHVISNIPKNQEYVEGSLTTDYKYGSEDSDNTIYEVASAEDADKSGTLVYKFGDNDTAIDNTYKITFKTRITDEDFYNNENADKSIINKEVENKVQLKADVVPDNVTSTAYCNIEIAPLNKTNQYYANTDLVKWTILVNENSLDIGKATIVDESNKYLKLDTSSIRLYKLNRKEGNLPGFDSDATEVEVNDNQVEYSYDRENGGVFKFTFDDLKEPYLLEYCTYIDPAVLTDNVTQIVNNAHFNGTLVKASTSSKVENVFFVEGQASGSMERPKGSISIKKLDTDTQQPLKGVTFKLYDRFNTLVDEKVTDENGDVKFSRLGLDTNYYVVESSALEGYTGENEKREFTLSKDNPEISVDWYNEVIKGIVKVIKVDEEKTDKKLSGAVFSVYEDKDGNNLPDGDEIAKLSENEINKGEYSARLARGQYLLKEVKAPEGYIPDERYFKFTIANNNEVVNVETEKGKNFTNKLSDDAKRGNIQLIKVEEGNFANRLSGAKFDLFEDSNNNGVYDCWDRSLGNLNEVEIGVYKKSNLKMGVYFVKEIKAPIGYVKDTTPYKVILNEDGQTVNVSNSCCTCSCCTKTYFTNRPIIGIFRGTPVNVSDLQCRRDGSKLYIYEDKDEDYLPDGEAIEVLSKNRFGEYVTELTYGTYLLREEKKSGDVLSNNRLYQFMIIEDNEVCNVIIG